MALLDDLSDDNSFGKAQSLYCAMCVLLKELPPAESKVLQKRLDDDKIRHTALSAVLKKNNISISDGVIGRHRRGVCSRVAK